VTILVGVVHTSPSITTLTRQVRDILEVATVIRDQTKLPLIMVGDFYAEKCKRLWAGLQAGREWTLVAPTKVTNYKKKSQGQIADIIVTSKDVQTMDYSTFTVAKNMPHALEEHDEEANTEKELKKWLEVDIDHVPVISTLILRETY
jgi:hypothetical protein